MVTVYRRSPDALRGLAGRAIGRETSGTAVLGERTLFACARGMVASSPQDRTLAAARHAAA